MDTLLEQLIQSPAIYHYLNTIEEILRLEKEKRNEFYVNITENQKAEFINGNIFIHSPVKLQHNEVVGFIFTLMNTYVNLIDTGYVGIEKILIALTRNDYEPDICYFSKTKSKKFIPHQMKFPAPDLIAEVLSPSTEENDRGIKFKDYAFHGVNEYWIVDPEEQFIEQYFLKDDTYKLKMKSSTGILKSFAIHDFEIPVESIFNKQKNLKTLSDFFRT